MMVGVENNSMTHRKIKRDVKQSQLWIGKYELTKRKVPNMTEYLSGPKHFRTGETIIQTNDKTLFSYEIHLKVNNSISQ